MSVTYGIIYQYRMFTTWQAIPFKRKFYLCIIYCVTNAVAVMYSRNIPIAEKRIVCFQSKQVKICRFLFISDNFYIYLKWYFEKCVATVMLFCIFRRSAALMSYCTQWYFNWFLIGKQQTPCDVNNTRGEKDIVE